MVKRVSKKIFIFHVELTCVLDRGGGITLNKNVITGMSIVVQNREGEKSRIEQRELR